MGLSRSRRRLRSLAACGALVLAACGTAPSSSLSSSSSSPSSSPSSTVAPLLAERPAGCRPELVSPEAVPIPSLDPASVVAGIAATPYWRLAEDGDQPTVGGPFGFTAPSWPGWGAVGHRFEDGRVASLVRFGCQLGAIVAGERVVSVWCDPLTWEQDPDGGRCSLEVHELPELTLASAFDVPIRYELVAAVGDLILFDGPADGVGAAFVVATDAEGVERWRASPVAPPDLVCVAGPVVVAAQERLDPDAVVGVATFDLGTGRPIAAADVDGQVVGCNDAGVWVLDQVTITDYGSTRAGDDGSLRVLDPETLQERARSGAALVGIRSATVDASGVFVQEHTHAGRIALGWLATDAASFEAPLVPVPVAELPLAAGGRSGAVPWSVVGHAEDGVWIGGLGVIPVLGDSG